MEEQPDNVLSTLLKKRLKTLGYPSLRKFHADRPGMGLSYEILRQVVYTGHVPRPETLFRILGSMQFSSSQAIPPPPPFFWLGSVGLAIGMRKRRAAPAQEILWT